MMRILIIGEVFHNLSGGGITLQNLFKDYPPNKLGFIEKKTNLNKLGLSKYNCYEINEKEIKYIFYRKKQSSDGPPIKIDDNKIRISSKRKSNAKSLFLRKLVKKILLELNLDKFFFVILSKEIEGWILDYNPDKIYCQPNSYDKVALLNKIHKKFKIPYVVHFMDDYALTIDNKGLLAFVFKKRYQNALSQLLRNSSKNLGICESMSQEYSIRFKLKFDYFHNPINFKDWNIKPIYDFKDNFLSNFNIVHAGRMTFPVINILFEIAKAVHKINLEHKGFKVYFDIYSNDKYRNANLVTTLCKFDGVRVLDPIDYSKMPKMLSEYQLLLLPLDFDKETIKYTRLSFSTKASEFMATGRPILVLAPEKTALSQHATTYDWSFVLNEGDANAIKNQLLFIRSNYPDSLVKAKKAAIYAKNNYDINQVSQDFQKLFQN